ncbi:MAG: hypothetical protein RIS64_2788 [Bacteroidota bacterium]|jgi:hypothetical protein
MNPLLNILFFKPIQKVPTETFDTPEMLFKGLKARKSAAYTVLIQNAKAGIAKIARESGLSSYETEDFIQYCVTEHMEQILDGRYVFQGNKVHSFTINQIATHRIHDYKRLLRGKSTVDLDAIEESNFEAFEADHDINIACKKIIAQLGIRCQQLIKLRFYNDFCDEVIIESKMTQYTDEELLRKARSRCYEKFLKLATEQNVFIRKLERLKADQAAKNNLKQLKELQNGSTK